ncbi:MAG: DUF4363 family protein [Peptostreptococcaceae bacterium]
MKALIYSLIFTVLFVILGTYFNSEIYKFTNEYIESISTLENHISKSEWDDAIIELNKYSNSFEDSKSFWYKIVDHQYFSEISTYLDTLNVAIKLNNSSLCLEQISKIRSTLDNIYENEEFTLNNIF